MSAGMAFEDQVRRVARAVWTLTPGDGQSRYIDTQEIDIVAHVGRDINLVMCTISKDLHKVKDDTRKLVTAREFLKRTERGKSIKCWIITRDVPHADQIRHSEAGDVWVEHFDEFQRSIINANQYFTF